MAEYRLTRGYSGIQYRIVELPEIRWAMNGYQADNDAAQQYIREIYEERGRAFLAFAVNRFWSRPAPSRRHWDRSGARRQHTDSDPEWPPDEDPDG
jgi:hypothetical protein